MPDPAAPLSGLSGTLSPKEAADYLGYAPQTLAGWRFQGRAARSSSSEAANAARSATAARTSTTTSPSASPTPPASWPTPDPTGAPR